MLDRLQVFVLDVGHTVTQPTLSSSGLPSLPDQVILALLQRLESAFSVPDARPTALYVIMTDSSVPLPQLELLCKLIVAPGVVVVDLPMLSSSCPS